MERKNATAVRVKRWSLKGWVYFALFVALIATGIVVKRVYHHPEWMAAFHLPAAVFLVLSGYDLTQGTRARHRAACEEWTGGSGI